MTKLGGQVGDDSIYILLSDNMDQLLSTHPNSLLLIFGEFNCHHASWLATANQITHFKEATLANMATVMSSSDADASGASADDSEGTSSGFCCMHVIATHSRVIPLAEKSFKKFKECANLWKEIENTPESKVAHNADRYGWDCVSAAEAPAKQPRHVDDDDERSGRRKRGTPGYHAECYRHFCNITEINRAIRRNKRQKEAATSTSRLAVIPEVEDSLDEEPPKRCLRSSIDKATPSVAGREHVLPVRCVICRTNQYVKDSGTGKRKVEKLMNCETMSGGQLLNAAMMKQDQRLLLDIRDKDLVAMEAKYHKSCYLRYTKVVHKSQTKVESSQQLYEKSYQSFCSKVVEERIIKGKEILRLTKLNRLFIKEVQHVESIDASSLETKYFGVLWSNKEVLWKQTCWS
uniref:uncharacterized protein n=1 Tax=Myxine glutinosa TaxID=7769 RepID=UPI00358E3588